MSPSLKPLTRRSSPRPSPKRKHRWTGVIGALGVVTGLCVVSVGATTAPAGAYSREQVFTAGGSFVVPDGVTAATFEVVGGRGGMGGSNLGAGGAGGFAAGVVATGPVVVGQTYTVQIGRAGGSGSNADKDDYGSGGAGYGGGGSGDTGSVTGRAGAGGGGATAVIVGGAAVVVAGGGGGGGGGGAFGNGGSGAGGAQNGEAGAGAGAGGGGAGNTGGPHGGGGGNAGSSSSAGGGGGGGGGYQGGNGGGGGGAGAGGGGGGAGGSNFVDTARFPGPQVGFSGESLDGFVRVTFIQRYATTTTVTTSTPNIVAGQQASFSVLVDPIGIADRPSGTVALFVGSTMLGTPLSVPVSGLVTATIDDLPVGADEVRAEFTSSSPDDFVGSIGQTTVQVDPAQAVVLLASSLNPSVAGQGVTFTATATPEAPATRVPTGTVSFYDGATLVGSAPLDATGAAQLSTADLAVATHPVRASYGGDARYSSVDSPLVNQVVNPGSTSVGLSSSANPSIAGEDVTFSANVTTGAGSSTAPTGTVTFSVDGELLDAPVGIDSSGQAHVSTSSLTVGSHEVSAAYSGDASWSAATSANRTQVVNRGGVSVQLSGPAAPSTPGQAATFSVAVQAEQATAGDPTGSLQLLVSGAPVGDPVAIAPDGSATFAISTLPVGTSRLTARYLGDDTFDPTLSNPVDHVVNPGDTAVTLTASAPGSNEGEEVTLRAEVAGADGVTGTPSGRITFSSDGAVIGSGDIGPDGAATLATSALTPGLRVLSAAYAGDGNFDPAASGPLNHQVTARPVTTDTRPAGSTGPSTASYRYGDGTGQPSAGGSLARTGADVLSLIGVGLATVLGGASLILIGRRRLTR